MNDEQGGSSTNPQPTPGQTFVPQSFQPTPDQNSKDDPAPTVQPETNEKQLPEAPQTLPTNLPQPIAEDSAHMQAHQQELTSEPSKQEMQGVRGSSHVEIAPNIQGDNVVSWEASEYIHHQKTVGWYLVLAAITLALAGLLYFVVDIWGAVITILMGITLFVYGNRKPEVIRYTLSHDGLSIRNKHFQFDQFRSFNIIHDGGLLSIELVPLKRFIPEISIYFDKTHTDQVVDILSRQLPHEDKNPDIIDRLARNIRF